MEYRGKTYTLVQGIGPNPWTWKVRLDEKTVRTGDAPTRTAARTSVIWMSTRFCDQEAEAETGA
jgi:hypothetical protein